MVERVEDALATHPGGDVWVVCHGGVINAYCRRGPEGPGQEMFMLPDNTSLNTVVVDGDERHLWFLNDTAHLSQPQLFEEAERALAYTRRAPDALRNRSRRRDPVSVKFLSEEWAQALKAELNANERLQGGRGWQDRHDPAGDQRRRRRDPLLDHDRRGRHRHGRGRLAAADATITETYETAVALAKSELSPVTAFMTGKVKIAGNMGMLLGLQAVLSLLPAAMSAIDIEY